VRHRWRRIVLVVAVVLCAAAVTAAVSSRRDAGPAPAKLTVGWGGSEGHPSCVYDASGGTVEARLVVRGTATRPGEVAVTVTAYADENTSVPVGSVTQSVPVEGTMQLPLVITIPVEAPPYVDEDGEAACRLDTRS